MYRLFPHDNTPYTIFGTSLLYIITEPYYARIGHFHCYLMDVILGDVPIYSVEVNSSHSVQGRHSFQEGEIPEVFSGRWPAPPPPPHIEISMEPDHRTSTGTHYTAKHMTGYFIETGYMGKKTEQKILP